MVSSPQKILMCAPDYFGVDYVINPWMEGHRGNTHSLLVQQQWENLKDTLNTQTTLCFVPPEPNIPDLVFTANAGLVLGSKVVVSRFESKERQREEPFFRTWFEKNGFSLVPWPKDISFEGAGDALLDRGQNLIWVGFGFRSDKRAPALIEKLLGRPTLALRLVDPRFYHLDTCLCPLPGGYVMYFPPAFDTPSQKVILDTIPETKRITVTEDDALKFACNAVDINNSVIMNDASVTLQTKLKNAGFIPILIPLSEFLKSGGAAKCLTLKLVEN